jgi:uncharacterized protein (TIGR02996 family)
LYTAPVDETRPLEEHILALWRAIQPHVTYLKSLKRTLDLEVLCRYRSTGRTAGFQVSPECLELFAKLAVPFSVRVVRPEDGEHDGEPLDCTASRIERERSAGGAAGQERQALFRAVCEQPWDDAVRLVYADWLEEHGQPQRAAFIRFQIENQGQERDRAWFQKALEFEPFEPLWQKEIPTLPGVKWSNSFQRGFLDAVVFESVKSFTQHAEAVFAASPLDDIGLRRVSDRTIREVLACPLLARLRGLRLLGSLTDEGVRQVASCPALARLEFLVIWGGDFGDAAAAAIARSPYLGRLKCLSFSDHCIGDRGVAALADSPNLVALTDLVLHGTRGLSPAVIQKLKKRFHRLD